MTNTKKVVYLIEETFWDNVTVFMNYTKEGLEKEIGRRLKQVINTEINLSDNWASFTIQNSSTWESIPIVWIRNYNNDAASESVFLHEISHFIFAALESRGIDAKWSDIWYQEVFCYKLEFYYKQWRKKINKIYGKKDKWDNRNWSGTTRRNNSTSKLKDKDAKAHSSHKWKGVKKDKGKIRHTGTKKNNRGNKAKDRKTSSGNGKTKGNT